MKIHINRAGQSLGQFTSDEVRAGYEAGKFTATDLAWRDGMPMWRPLGEVIDEIAPAARGDAGGHPVPPPMGDPAGIPWEKRAESGFFPAMMQTITGVLLEPAKTFRAMPSTGGLGAPLLFYTICVVISSVAALVYQFTLETFVPAAASDEGSLLKFFSSSLAIGIVLVLLPLMVAAAAFVGSGITHLGLMLVGGAKKSFQTTFRVFCYAGGATGILQLIPACGALVGGVWNIVAMTIGLSEAHGIGRGRALFAVLLPLVAACALVLAAVVIGIMNFVPGAVQD